MLETTRHQATSFGHDATHQASKKDTHLTHGCMAQFRQFSRVRRECADGGGIKNRAIAPFSESARRTLGKVAT
jgi:hypothetical protein